VNIPSAAIVLNSGGRGLVAALAAPGCGCGRWWAQDAPSDINTGRMKRRAQGDMAQS
jgi:hypothetical protein